MEFLLLQNGICLFLSFFFWSALNFGRSITSSHYFLSRKSLFSARYDFYSTEITKYHHNQFALQLVGGAAINLANFGKLPDSNYSMLVDAFPVDFVLEQFATMSNHQRRGVEPGVDLDSNLNQSRRLNVWHFGSERRTQQWSEFVFAGVASVACALVAMLTISLRALFSRSALVRSEHCCWYLRLTKQFRHCNSICTTNERK